MVALEERLPIEEVTDLIRVGEPLPFKVLDQLARLLLNEGQTIVSERQYELLLERGAWVDRRKVEAMRLSLGTAAVEKPEMPQRTFSVFDRWERLVWELDSVLRRTAKGHPAAAEWAKLVDDVVAAIDRHVDIALFGAVCQQDRRYALYPLSHSLHSAVLCVLTARQAEWPSSRWLPLVGAALSMNTAMLELQAQMAEQDEPPRQRQLEAIRAHPMQAVQRLQSSGIQDPLWLRAVAEHHERNDGSGYPKGLTQVSEEARLLRMADVYMAKITPRAGRPPLSPVLASRQLFQSEAGSALALTLIKAIGVYPPGALVKLASGEVAVVKARPTQGSAPTVFTLSDAHGVPRADSHVLDSAEAAHAIVGPCPDASAFARIPGERVYGVVPG